MLKELGVKPFGDIKLEESRGHSQNTLEGLHTQSDLGMPHNPQEELKDVAGKKNIKTTIDTKPLPRLKPEGVSEDAEDSLKYLRFLFDIDLSVSMNVSKPHPHCSMISDYSKHLHK